MPHRQQFRTYAEYCLRLAELINSPDQKVKSDGPGLGKGGTGVLSVDGRHTLAQEQCIAAEARRSCLPRRLWGS